MSRQFDPSIEKKLNFLARKYNALSLELGITIEEVFLQRPKERDQYGYLRGIGEYSIKYFSPSRKNIVFRLFSHIKSLAVFLNQRHMSFCLDEKKILKPEWRYHITRLCTNEFSFYTQEPLSLENFSSLVTHLQKMAEKLSQNLHLMLSSFAVTSGNRLFNLTVYLECGETPVIRVFQKNIASKKDLDYGGRFNLGFFYQLGQKALPIPDFYRIEEPECSLLVSNHSLFEVTVHDAKFIQSIDICIAHANNTSATLLKKAFAQHHDYIFPNVSHILISNVFHVCLNESIFQGDKMLQIDPLKTPKNVERYQEGRLLKKFDRASFALEAELISLGISPLNQLAHVFNGMRQEHNRQFIFEKYHINLENDLIEHFLQKTFLENNLPLRSFLLDVASPDLLRSVFSELVSPDQQGSFLHHCTMNAVENEMMIALRENNWEKLTLYLSETFSFSAAVLNEIGEKSAELPEDICHLLLKKHLLLKDQVFSVLIEQMNQPYSKKEIEILETNAYRLPTSVFRKITEQLQEFSDNFLLNLIDNDLIVFPEHIDLIISKIQIFDQRLESIFDRLEELSPTTLQILKNNCAAFSEEAQEILDQYDMPASTLLERPSFNF